MCKGQVFSTPRLMISDTPHASGQQPAVGAAIDVAEEDRPAAIAPPGHMMRQAGRTTRAHRATASRERQSSIVSPEIRGDQRPAFSASITIRRIALMRVW